LGKLSHPGDFFLNAGGTNTKGFFCGGKKWLKNKLNLPYLDNRFEVVAKI
jgi:hypothetical protein